MNPVLLTTVHDPRGQLLKATQAQLTNICELYDWRMVVEATDNTDSRLLRPLSFCAQVHQSPAGDIARARRSVLRAGLRYFPSAHYHFVDFDRLLHWQLNYPNELKWIVDHLSGYEFTILGRTTRALDTHPFIQRETERFVNTAFGVTTGRWVDVLTASRGISNSIARKIVGSSVAEGPAGIDCEWPLIASQYCRPHYIPTDGLEYETDTFGMRRPGWAEFRLRFKNLQQGLRVLYAANRTWDFQRNAESPAANQPGT